MKDIKLSIVTISYNSERYLEECIESVVSQLTEEVEYILVDGKSSDNTQEILKKHALHFSSLIVEKDKGPADALNKGFVRAKGEFVFYLNSDDFLLPNAISKMLSIISYTDSDVVYGRSLLLQNGVLSKIISDRWNLINYITGRCMIVQHSTLIRKSSFQKLKYGFNKENRDNWDGELLVDLDLSGARFRYHKEVFAVFRIHNQSITGQQLNKKSLAETRFRIKKKVMDTMSFSAIKIMIAFSYLVINLFTTKIERFISYGFSIYSPSRLF